MPAATFVLFESFVEAVAEKKHNLGSDGLKVALTNALPDEAANTVLANITEISYTGLSSRALTQTGSAQSGGTYKLSIQDLVLTASGADVGPFQYVVIYNDTATNDELIGYLAYPAAIRIYDGETFTIDFDGTNGLLQFAIV